MTTANVYVGKAYFAAFDQGWSESYWLLGATPSTAKTNLQAITAARKTMLYKAFSILYSYVSQLGVNRDSFIAQAGTIIGTDTVTADEPDDAETCIILRQESSAGNICNRYIHAVPPDVVVGRAYITGVNTAFDAALTAYITALTANTGYLTTTVTAGVKSWSVANWGVIQYRSMGRHKCGRPFDTSRGRHQTA